MPAFAGIHLKFQGLFKVNTIQSPSKSHWFTNVEDSKNMFGQAIYLSYWHAKVELIGDCFFPLKKDMLGFKAQKIFGWIYQETLKLPIVVRWWQIEIGGRGALTKLLVLLSFQACITLKTSWLLKGTSFEMLVSIGRRWGVILKKKSQVITSWFWGCGRDLNCFPVFRNSPAFLTLFIAHPENIWLFRWLDKNW